ncbi:MAG TPA: sigma-70 family RNA polymerase sigma factor [Acetobacteraceae bacterium]|nr:sigma-70 family RNA polymerase sigma factor [Acetobacteraceae bacterium]
MTPVGDRYCWAMTSTPDCRAKAGAAAGGPVHTNPVHIPRVEVALNDTSTSRMQMEPDLAVLIQRCAGQDRAALRLLYDRQAARLYGIALRLTRQSALAADVVHDAFIAVWQRAASFDPNRGSATSWLVSIVRHRAIDIIRRRDREVPDDALPEAADSDPDPLARLVESDDAASLHRCLGTLEDDKRRMILLAFVDGLSHSELAVRLAIPLGTVKSSIRRGLAALKRCLEP